MLWPSILQIRKLAEAKEKENLSFRKFLKHCDLETDDIDHRVLIDAS